MRREKIETTQRFFPVKPSRLRSRRELLEELSRPCGRFKSPMTTEERLKVFINTSFDAVGVAEVPALSIAAGTPLNWKLLLQYLHSKKMITHPYFSLIARGNDTPWTIDAILHATDITGNTDGRAVLPHGFASSRSVEETFTKAVGEFLERYFLTLYRRKTLFKATYNELRTKVRAVPIDRLNGFLPFQKKKNTRLDRSPDAPFYWVRGTELLSNTRAYIPAQLVYWNYLFDADAAEPLLAQPTTNGCAGHVTREEAIIGGLLELIQRDGFLIYWMNRLSPRVIDVSGVDDPELQSLLEDMRAARLQVYFLNATTDLGIPTVICAVVDTTQNEPMIAVGGAAGFDLKKLLLSSVYEGLTVYSSFRDRPPFTLPTGYEPFSDNTIGRTERLSVWKGKEMYDRFSFFISGPRQQAKNFIRDMEQFDSPSKQLAYLSDTLRKLGPGYEVFVYEAAHDVLKTLGYHAMRTVVPQLVPLHLNEHLATLDSVRLREVPARLGYKPAEKYNPWPHPFP